MLLKQYFYFFLLKIISKISAVTDSLRIKKKGVFFISIYPWSFLKMLPFLLYTSFYYSIATNIFQAFTDTKANV